MTEFETRVGQGYDVHALLPHEVGNIAAKRVVRLCGIDVPFDSYLDGHSDADVGLHALVDAILGALCEGDIGTHFPQTEPMWRGADSARFVLHAQHIMKQKNAQLVNADITLICEKPRVAPYREAMRARVAELLNVSVNRISVKATTTERLGFEGRGEGISAQAIVAVKMPFHE